VRDAWPERGSLHLLNLIRRLYGKCRRVPGRAASAEAMARGWSDAGATFTHNVGMLVSAKNAWASAMREAEYSTGAVPSGEQQRTAWNALLGDAGAKFREGEDGPAPRIPEGDATHADLERLRVDAPLEWLRQVRPRVLALGLTKGLRVDEIEVRLMRYLRDGPR
jgi:hypothetical protein